VHDVSPNLTRRAFEDHVQAKVVMWQTLKYAAEVPVMMVSAVAAGTLVSRN
jgi:hypothetical protein